MALRLPEVLLCAAFAFPPSLHQTKGKLPWKQLKTKKQPLAPNTLRLREKIALGLYVASVAVMVPFMLLPDRQVDTLSQGPLGAAYFFAFMAVPMLFLASLINIINLCVTRCQVASWRTAATVLILVSALPLIGWSGLFVLGSASRQASAIVNGRD